MLFYKTSEERRSDSFTPNAVANSAYYKRYEGIVRIGMMRKFVYYEKNCPPLNMKKKENFILPPEPGMINFNETVFILCNIFGDRSCLFNIHWQCLNLVEGDDEDFVTYAVVNRKGDKFTLHKLTPDLFKCLIFVQGLSSNKDAKIRPRILGKLEIDPKLTLRKIPEECQCIGNV